MVKGECLCKIYERDNQEYAETMQVLRDLYRASPDYGLKLRNIVVKLTSTTQATVQQFIEVLTWLSRFCAESGIQLPADPGLEGLAMAN